MELIITTKQELDEFRNELLREIKAIIQPVGQQEEELLSTRAAMKALNVKSYSTIIAYVNQGLLSKRRLGAHNYYLKSEILKLKK
ncbi:MAG: hypothetical protein LBJ63_00450 [Prevotellaceae bacterium]|jgi:hypothetical protein|nr:hypothetical protein [Prevotellaceae bacterium]